MLFKTQAATNYKLPTWKTPTLLMLSQFFAFHQNIAAVHWARETVEHFFVVFLISLHHWCFHKTAHFWSL